MAPARVAGAFDMSAYNRRAATSWAPSPARLDLAHGGPLTLTA
ncbi:unnamed protein product [Mycetohabitans rhizoxinica HKI 454]|uniref:Uncharacterized protein n=1 Tax=Mycetohabitans rhizoxinica (strain DSM 19002 / CIP 109453 / HKI 454) TaxID=882378 RepID=E5AQR9_MYCRK|nr:unnamed protein product [Mycetohabitans rhizoxinica HKI 454]